MWNALQPLLSAGRLDIRPRGSARTHLAASRPSRRRLAVVALFDPARGRPCAPRRGSGASAAMPICMTVSARSVPDWPAFPDSAEALGLSQAPLQARHPFECRSHELRRQQREARRDLRCRLHGRGCRLLQARSAQLRLHARRISRPISASTSADPAHGPEPVSRPCAGRARRAGARLDRPPLRQGGRRRYGRREKQPQVDFHFKSLAELADAHRKA